MNNVKDNNNNNNRVTKIRVSPNTVIMTTPTKTNTITREETVSKFIREYILKVCQIIIQSRRVTPQNSCELAESWSELDEQYSTWFRIETIDNVRLQTHLEQECIAQWSPMYTDFSLTIDISLSAEPLKKHILLERWKINFRKNKDLMMGHGHGHGHGHGRGRHRKGSGGRSDAHHLLLKNSSSKGMGNNDPSLIYKRMCIQIRSILSYLRLLPAHQIVKLWDSMEVHHSNINKHTVDNDSGHGVVVDTDNGDGDGDDSEGNHHSSGSNNGSASASAASSNATRANMNVNVSMHSYSDIEPFALYPTYYTDQNKHEVRILAFDDGQIDNYCFKSIPTKLGSIRTTVFYAANILKDFRWLIRRVPGESPVLSNNNQNLSQFLQQRSRYWEKKDRTEITRQLLQNKHKHNQKKKKNNDHNNNNNNKVSKGSNKNASASANTNGNENNHSRSSTKPHSDANMSTSTTPTPTPTTHRSRKNKNALSKNYKKNSPYMTAKQHKAEKASPYELIPTPVSSSNKTTVMPALNLNTLSLEEQQQLNNSHHKLLVNTAVMNQTPPIKALFSPQRIRGSPLVLSSSASANSHLTSMEDMNAEIAQQEVERIRLSTIFGAQPPVISLADVSQINTKKKHTRSHSSSSGGSSLSGSVLLNSILREQQLLSTANANSNANKSPDKLKTIADSAEVDNDDDDDDDGDGNDSKHKGGFGSIFRTLHEYAFKTESTDNSIGDETEPPQKNNGSHGNGNGNVYGNADDDESKYANANENESNAENARELIAKQELLQQQQQSLLEDNMFGYENDSSNQKNEDISVFIQLCENAKHLHLTSFEDMIDPLLMLSKSDLRANVDLDEVNGNENEKERYFNLITNHLKERQERLNKLMANSNIVLSKSIINRHSQAL